MHVTLLAYTQMTYDKPHSLLAQQLADYVATGERAFNDALVEYAGRICYNTTNKLGHNPKFVYQRVHDDVHIGLLEHCSATFLVENISRSCLQQLVRHGLMSHSVVSTRYVEQDESNTVEPASITANPIAAAIYRQVVKICFMAYGILRDLNIPREDCMFLLPECNVTTLLLSGNFSMYRNLLQQRLAPAAKWEIKSLAQIILRELHNIAPLCFGDLWEQYK